MRGEVGDAAQEFDDIKSDLAEYLLVRLDGYDPEKARLITYARRVLDNGIKHVRRYHYRHISRYVPLSAASEKMGHGLGRLADEEGYDLLHLNGPADTETDTEADAFAADEEREAMSAVLHKFDGDPLATVIAANMISPHPLVTAAVSAIECRGGVRIDTDRIPTEAFTSVFGVYRCLVSAATTKIANSLGGPRCRKESSKDLATFVENEHAVAPGTCFGSAIVDLNNKHCSSCPRSASCISARSGTLDLVEAYSDLAAEYDLPTTPQILGRLQYAAYKPTGRRNTATVRQGSLLAA
jgi:hypothetical protein